MWHANVTFAVSHKDKRQTKLTLDSLSVDVMDIRLRNIWKGPTMRWHDTLLLLLVLHTSTTAGTTYIYYCWYHIQVYRWYTGILLVHRYAAVTQVYCWYYIQVYCWYYRYTANCWYTVNIWFAENVYCGGGDETPRRNDMTTPFEIATDWHYNCRELKYMHGMGNYTESYGFIHRLTHTLAIRCAWTGCECESASCALCASCNMPRSV